MAEDAAGEAIAAQGLLVRAAGGFLLRCDDGRRLALDLVRTPVDHVEKRVSVEGRLVAADRLEVTRIGPA